MTPKLKLVSLLLRPWRYNNGRKHVLLNAEFVEIEELETKSRRAYRYRSMSTRIRLASQMNGGESSQALGSSFSSTIRKCEHVNWHQQSLASRLYLIGVYVLGVPAAWYCLSRVGSFSTHGLS